MKKHLFLCLFLLLPLFYGGCSSDEAIPCGDGFCRSGEVCEAGQCVLGIVLDEGAAVNSVCYSDQDCPSGKICTEDFSEPANSCIPILPCERDGDCQLGLHCGEDDVCR